MLNRSGGATVMPSLLAAAALACVPMQVHDGDTFRCASGERIRLAGIDSNELNGTCHTACAPMPARQARDYLAGLVLGKRVVCEPTGRSYRRVVAWCSVGRLDLSCAMIRAGAAVRWQRYDPEGWLKGCER